MDGQFSRQERCGGAPKQRGGFDSRTAHSSSQHIIKMDKHTYPQPTSTRRVSGGTRVYYIDTYKDSKGSPFLSISEIPTDRSEGSKKRQRVFVHPEHLAAFQEAVNAAIEHIRNDIER